MIQWDIDAGQLVQAIVPAMTVWREAANQGSAGMTCVAMVIRNRMLQRHQTAEQVCLAEWQFSSMNAPKDPGMLHWPGPNDVSFQAAYEAWQASATIDPEDDPTKGCTLYYATSIQPPVWTHSPKTKFVVEVGTQRFYREI